MTRYAASIYENLSGASEQRLKQMALTKAGKQTQLEDLSDKCGLDMYDRRELDLAVLEMLGVSKKKDRENLVDNLYQYYEGVL
jgi:hypothetical protein